jgi:hypothetical protein
MRVFYWLLLSGGLAAMGVGALTANATLLQGVVLLAIGALVLGRRTGSGGEWIKAGFYFLSGAGIGALSYHGEVSILVWVMWAALFVWIEREIRDEVSLLLEAVGEWLD